MNAQQIQTIETQIQKMIRDGRYYYEFLNLFGRTKNIGLCGEEHLQQMSNYLTKKGF